MNEVSNISDDKIDELEAMMLKLCAMAEFPLTHLFLPGMYIRQIFMEKDTLVTSLIHKTVHPFFVSKGKVSVFSDNDGEQLLETGHVGITTPGTRRVLYMHEDTVWLTTHALPWITGAENSLSEEEKLKVVSQIEDLILEPHINEYFGGQIKNNILSQLIDTL